MSKIESIVLQASLLGAPLAQLASTPFANAASVQEIPASKKTALRKMKSDSLYQPNLYALSEITDLLEPGKMMDLYTLSEIMDLRDPSELEKLPFSYYGFLKTIV